MNTLCTVIASLVLAVVVAVAEAMLRWRMSTDTIDAPQLALAVFGNVAALGTLAVLVAGIVLAAGWLAGRMIPSLRSGTRDYASCIVLGIVVSILVFQTGGLGLDRGLPDADIVAMYALLLGAVTVLCVGHTRRSTKRPLSNFAKGTVVTVWLLCVAATGVAAVKTNNHIAEWTRDTTSSDTPSDDPPPNIVLVVLDTLRADRVGVYGHHKRDLTPNLDRLAESSIVYTNALSNAPWTLPTHASLFTGLYPDTHGVSWGHYELDDSWPVLSELLKDRGYDTFAISNNVLLSSENGFARGYDSFIETT